MLQVITLARDCNFCDLPPKIWLFTTKKRWELLKGFKPGQMTYFLEVGNQTFRYWKENLDPGVSRKSFNTRDLLVYRIIKVLVAKRGLCIKVLKKFNMELLFEWGYSTSMDTAKDTLLIFDTGDWTIEFKPSDTRLDIYNIDLHYLQLHSVVQEHEAALLNFGEKQYRDSKPHCSKVVRLKH